MADHWRLFVAVPIGEELRSELAASVESWRARPGLEGLRWTEPSTWHVTLHFIGATEPGEVGRISEALSSVARRHEPMRIPTMGLGGFPRDSRARVIWYGAVDINGDLGRLAADIRASLAPGTAETFRPHVTLARARGRDVDLRPWVEASDSPEGELFVDRMLLMRSHLGRGPARHETVASVQVGAGVRV